MAPSGTTQGDRNDWQAIASDPQFLALLAARRRFVVPAVLFFIAYYFALPVLVGWFPRAMERPVIGEINVGYLFALSQFFMAWGLMWIYVRRARAFDAMAAGIVARQADRRALRQGAGR